MSISLVAGLGNPGREYERTRHNLGWILLDALARQHGWPLRLFAAEALAARAVPNPSAAVAAAPSAPRR